MNAPFADDTSVTDLPPASPDDKSLTLAFQSGDKGAYDAIHARYEERVHRVCRRMLGKPEDAQEAAQETFLRVYTALGKFNGRYQLGAWITRIATNVCLDQIRSRSRRPVDATPVEDMELDLLASGSDSDPEAASVRASESRHVRKVLLGLPPLHRAAIVLRDFEGLSYAEVAITLGMTECQVKALIHRARKGFRRSWTPLVEMLVPARALQRLREMDSGVKEQLVNAAASQSAPVATACSGLLQHCGAFVFQKALPFTTSVILGGASALAAPLVGEGPQRPSHVEVAPASVDNRATRTPATSGRVPDGDATATPAGAPKPTPPPSGAPSAPPEEPTEAPTPSASPPPAASASPSPAAGAVSPKETAPPAPFAPVFYFQSGHTPTPREPNAHSVSVDCQKMAVTQSISAEVSDHEGVYPMEAHLKTGSAFEIAFTVRKKGFAVNYTGGGALIGQSNSGNTTYLTFNGRYGSDGTAAASAGLPANGSIRIELAIDCSAQSLITESVVLATQ